jgi:EAL domain-containing protein (putative c-di-GMP-specific phosphodiesterase class I)
MTEHIENSPDLAPDATPPADDQTPVCFIIDEDASIRRFLSLILQGSGIDTEEFADGAALREALQQRSPDLVFLNIPLDASDAIGCIKSLGEFGCRGAIQLISARGAAVLETVKNIGEQLKLRMLPVLKKPFETTAIVGVINEQKLGIRSAMAARLSLEEVLANNWIEFWHQPKVDIRKKQLVGAETLARARHPQYGVLSPEAFMPGADDASLLALSELALQSALQTGQRFSQLGINLRFAINVPVTTLAKLDVNEIVRAQRSSIESWPGLLIDIPEEQVITETKLAIELSKKFAASNVRLAIDDFGRGYSSLTRYKELPFAEVKIDRTFVQDCATDKVNAPICKSVIALAHSWGSVAVAMGIEKASDVLALLSMGCDLGQGFLLGQPMPEERFTALLKQRASYSRAAAAALAPERKSA